MNLPFILDLAIGLIFIYLILSLLASEIQELLATIFQWRAEHLKRSIELLLAGGRSTSEEPRVIKLSNIIYDNPLIRNINQEAKGSWATLPRKLTWAMGSLYRSLKKARPGTNKQESIFGDSKRSGPSYIPSETFATTLIETLQIPALIQKSSESRLENFKNEKILRSIKEIYDNFQNRKFEADPVLLNEIKIELGKLERGLNKVIEDFKGQKITLINSIERMSEKLDVCIYIFQTQLADNERIHRDLIQPMESLKEEVFGSTPERIETEKLAIFNDLKPRLTEIIETLRISSTAYREIEATIQDKTSPTYQAIEEAVHILPDSVIESLYVLAHRAESKVKNTESDIEILRQEIELWFDRSMDRASGVYKRNAKGVALLIGIAIAVAANADIFHMANRLSKDSAIRTTITENAGEIVT